MRYIQKFVEVEISNRTTKLSIPSLLVGAFGIAISFIAIGLAFLLVWINIDSVTKIEYFIGGIIIISMSIELFFMINKYRKKFDDMTGEIEFMHKIVLETERRM